MLLLPFERTGRSSGASQARRRIRLMSANEKGGEEGSGFPILRFDGIEV
jgi:hypothetical protein